MQRSMNSLGRAGASPRLVAALTAFTTLGSAGAASAAPALDRTWGTYFGGDSLEYAHDLAFDAAGNVYVVGTTTSLAKVATAGAHQTEQGGNDDAYLAKFDPAGSLVWATYFGGESQDFGAGLAVRAGTVAIAGRSRSTSGIATRGSFQPTHNGGEDGFVAVFDLDGALKWSTYIGSAFSEEAFQPAIDDQGSVYAVGFVADAVPGLSTPGTHQPDFETDAGLGTSYLVKFNPEGQVEWGTYYGGGGSTWLESVTLNDLGELYASGGVESASKAIPSPGAHQSQYSDVFLVRFNLDGTRAWGTYYGGLLQERDTSVVALPQGGVVLSGETFSEENIASPGSHQPEIDGGRDQFIARFDAAGVRLWGTYYGYDWSQSVGKISVDAGGSIYICGETNWSGGYGMPNGWLPEYQGGDDAYLAKLSGDGVLQWGSYYGGDQLDGCGKIRVDANYRVYILGGTASTSGIATPGAYQEEYVGAGLDSFLVQFTQPIGAACVSPDDCGGGPCVDGVCCDSPCGGGAEDCQNCSVAGGAVADGVCTPAAADVVCRPSAGTCDAAEFCPGNAGTCPDDMPAADGDPCDDGVCSAGACVPAEATTTTGDAPTTGASDVTGGPVDESTSDSSGEASSASGGAQSDAGCGCRSVGGGGLLAAPLLLVLGRRRRAVSPQVSRQPT